MSNKYSIGDNLHGFKLKNTRYIKNIKATIYEFEHLENKLKVVITKNGDRHRAFNISFRTPPLNDKGITHILEHCVLAGSRKYPLKDPFFTIKSASPSTYMNASTYPERTYYNASSHVKKDFENLFSIYFDAVFFPLLKKETFWREGYRLEVEGDTKNFKLKHQGVVFNEMKGALNDPDLLAYKAVKSAVHNSDNVYSYVSGGIPKDISELKYEEMVQYHKSYYVPSNACISLYGNIDIERYLSLVNSELNEIEINKKSEEVRFKSDIAKNMNPVKVEVQRPESVPKDRAKLLVFNFLGPEVNSTEELIDWSVLNLLLLENDFSPIKLAINRSNIGDDIWYGSGLSIDKQVNYIIGVNGAGKEDADNLYELIIDTIEEIKKKGFEKNKLKYLVKKFEIFTRAYSPPISIVNSIATEWSFNRDIFEQFDTDRNLKELKKRIFNKEYVNKLIEKLFINNNNYNYVYTEPRDDYIDTQNLNLDKLLEEKSKHIKDVEVKELIKENELLNSDLNRIDTIDDLKKLPSLNPSDINIESKDVPEDINEDTNYKVLWHNQQTKGIVDGNAYIHIPGVTSNNSIYLQLLAELIGRIGVSNKSSEETVKRIENEIATSIDGYITHLNNPDNSKTITLFNISFSSLNRDFKKVLEIVYEYIFQINLDDKEIVRTVIKEMFNGAESDMINSGTYTSMIIASKNDGEYGRINYILNGPEYLRAIKKLYKESENSLDKIISELKRVSNELKNQHITFNITSNNANSESFRDKLYERFRDLNVKSKVKKVVNEVPTSLDNNEIWECNTDVSYSAIKFKGPNFKSEDYSAVKLMTFILEDLFLHKAIREKSGAYGAGATNSSNNESICFSSYRDPDISSTIGAYKEAVDWIKSGEFTTKQLKNSICQIIGKIDRPNSPIQKGYSKGLNTISEYSFEAIQAYKRKILKLKKEDIIRVANMYLDYDKARIVAMANKQVTNDSAIEKLFKKVSL